MIGNKVEGVDSGPAEIGCQIPNGGSPKLRWEPSGCGLEKGPFAEFSLDTDSLDMHHQHRLLITFQSSIQSAVSFPLVGRSQ